ncbi:M16 family metallopeptidase [Lentzea nigeriaca]|uniref:M16 family metallopeptidase n=1 Tax=Lentzea nigeriaca TaxID=1128665 RepID=UPI00195DD449|nr:insulinase family protein [Lentzea nigeriaca]MBM7862098.1 putative Zn-dependent peptidase [Lentzea nigeriaca]
MIRHTEVDGVPTFITPTRGPMRAGLVFRVGVADETLATSGITHLVEHLALSEFALPDSHANGMTGMINTHFYVQGAPEDVSTFLTRACDAITTLPLDRLERERTIVRTEAASRSGAAFEMQVWRYGAQGYGLAGSNDFGVEVLGPEDVRAWAADWFALENAVLWIAGEDVPPGLRLRLPGGVRRPPPPAKSILPLLPAYFANGSGQVMMDSVVSRSMAAHVLSTVIERRLFQKLRHEQGGSYVTTAAYRWRDAEYGTITALADTLPENQDVVVNGFIEVLAALKAGDIPAVDVEAGKTMLREFVRDPDFEVGSLRNDSADFLNGGRPSTVEELLAESDAITTDDVHAVAVEAMGSALLHLPAGHEADWAGFARAPLFSPAVVRGTKYATHEPSGESIVVGTSGVSLITPGGPITIRYDQCVAAEAWPHGARRLVGVDGLIVGIDPRYFAIDQKATAMIDAGVPPSAVVRRPALQEEPDKPAAVEEPRAEQPPVRSALRTAVRALTGILFTAWFVFALLATAGVATRADADATDWVAIALIWFIGWPFKNVVLRYFTKLRAAH